MMQLRNLMGVDEAQIRSLQRYRAQPQSNCSQTDQVYGVLRRARMCKEVDVHQ